MSLNASCASIDGIGRSGTRGNNRRRQRNERVVDWSWAVPGLPSRLEDRLPFRQIEGDELGEPLDQSVHRVRRRQVDRQEHALAVIRRDDEMMIAVDEVTHVLRLM